MLSKKTYYGYAFQHTQLFTYYLDLNTWRADVKTVVCELSRLVPP